jgi:hypothetical protein
MRKGLNVTLMTVAVALIGMRAMAMAPTISDIPSPIVSDGDTGTQANQVWTDNNFVYPDALALDIYVSDPDGPNPIVWSHAQADPEVYTFNGVAGLDLGSEDPVAPGAKEINTQVLGGEQDIDGDAGTVTIRNERLSPLAQDPGPYPDPAGGPGILDSETKVVTLFASDGASISQTDVIVYTEDDGYDRLSTGDPFSDVLIETFTGGAGDWRFAQGLVEFGTVTSSEPSGTLCMEVTAAGLNDGEWFSDYPWFDLVDNNIWRIRFNMTTTASAAGNTPLVAFLVDNTDPDDPFGAANAFNQEHFFLDNLSGANAPLGSSWGLAQHQYWFTPPQVSTPQWRSTSTGAFDPANDSLIDARGRFRVFDIDGGGWNAAGDAGTVCIDNIDVDRADLSLMTVLATPYDVQNITDSLSGGTHLAEGLVGTTVNFSGGNVTMSPSDTQNGWTAEVAAVTPGDNVNNPGLGGADIVDNYPLTWVADQLLMIEVNVSAPDAAAAGSPPDLIRFGFDGPTNEIIELGVVTGSLSAAGMPTTTSATYRSFMYTHEVTLSTVSEHNRLRPRMDLICNPALNFSGQTENMGGITVENMTVRQVRFGP